MRFSTALLVAFASLAIAAPTPNVKRAAVLTAKTYDEISISGGTAGNGEAEALAVFSALDLNDLANGKLSQRQHTLIMFCTDRSIVDPADVKFLGGVNDVGNAAEKGAFNTAISAASGDAAQALQNGKIKNKILKLTATSLELQIQAAQGKDTAAKLASETKKLNNNIALDKAAAGQASTKLTFDANIV